MVKQLSNYKYLSIFLFFAAFLLYASNIGGYSIYILDEAKNASCAREMLDRSDWIVPTFNNVLRMDKPPLHYYFMMLSYSIFGVNPFAARFFSAVFGALTILVCFLFTRKFAGALTATWTALVLLASVHLSIQFHLAVPDPYLIFFFTSAVMAFYAAVKEKKWKYILALYASIGLGTLTKGPVAIALPGLIFLLFLIFSKRFNWKEIKTLKPFLGVLIVLIIALPWYILVHIKTNGAWTEGFFFHHNLERFESEMEGHGGIFLLTILYVLIGLIPFAVFIVQALKLAFKNKKDDFVLFNLVAGLTIIAFFMVSQTKLLNYTVPSYPYLAILIALYIQGGSTEKLNLKWSMLVLLVISILLVPGLYFGLKLDSSLSSIAYIAFYFLPFPLLVIYSFVQYIKGKTEHSLLFITASGIITGLVFFIFAFPVIDRQNPVAKSIDLLKGKEVRYFLKFNASYAFYLKKEIPPIDDNEFETFFRENSDGVIISTTRNLEKTELPEDLEVSFTSPDILEAHTTVLITRKE